MQTGREAAVTRVLLVRIPYSARRPNGGEQRDVHGLGYQRQLLRGRIHDLEVGDGY